MLSWESILLSIVVLYSVVSSVLYVAVKIEGDNSVITFSKST